jgi:chemosensory pili system protein ChpA (sensor histidine kinase/response regulator)
LSDKALIELLQEGLDALAAQVDAAADDQPMGLAGDLLARLEQAAESGAPIGPAPAAAPDAAGAAEEAAVRAADTDEPEGELEGAAAQTSFRVSTEWLDAMIGLAGEIGTYRARMLAQNTRLGLRAAQLDEAVRRITRRLDRVSREAELGAGDGARLGRRLAQTQQAVSDVAQLTLSVGELQRDTSDLLRQQLRLAADLQDGLLHSRMVPFGQIESRLHRLLRQIAPDLGKEAVLVIYGGDVELDRHVLERVVAPLEHLLRNAVVHGIESPDVRERHGKPRSGFITVGVEREGNDIVCTVADDGAGMDLTQIRAHGEAHGLIAADALVSEDEILALTLQPGFSTVESVTQLAGRGIGLDVVNAEITALNGDLELRSEPGLGVSFTIRLPLTLSIVEALLLTAGGTLYAVPHGSALAVARVERERLAAGGEVSVRYGGEDYQVRSLVASLEAQGGRPSRRPLPKRRWLPVLLVRAGSQRIALQVDSLIGSQRVMIKPIGPPLGALRWLSGGTLLADGRVALLLDVMALLRQGAPPGSAVAGGTPRLLLMKPSAAARRLADVLRQRIALHVRTAGSHAQAQDLLRRALPDLVILDADTSGAQVLDVADRLRADQRLQQVPIVLIAAEADAALQAQALAAGIDRVLVQPLDEDMLATELEALLRVQRA